MKKIITWITNIVVGVLIFIVILSIVSRVKNNNGYILKHVPMTVLTGSMEPHVKVGDMIVSKKIDCSDIKAGDIITFKMGDNTFVTHRVIERVKENGNLLFKTKGDANNVEDSDLVLEENVVGKLAFRIPKGGYIADIFRSPLGFIAFFAIPIVILIGNEIMRMNTKSKKQHDNL